MQRTGCKILKEVELIGLIDEVTQEIKTLRDKIVIHKKGSCRHSAAGIHF